MALKPLAGSRRSVWFVARKVSVFLTACAVGCGGTQKEQVAEWEMCVFLEFCFLGFPGNQYYLPSQLESCVVSSFGCCWPLAYVHKKAGKGVFFTLPRHIPAAVPEMVAVLWVAAAPAVLQLAMKDKPCPEILRPHKSDSSPFDWRWLGCRIWLQGGLRPFVVQQQMALDLLLIVMGT